LVTPSALRQAVNPVDTLLLVPGAFPRSICASSCPKRQRRDPAAHLPVRFGISVLFVGPAVAPVAGQGRYHIHADALSPASWTAIHSYLTGGVVAPRWDLAGYARLHSRGHAVRLMKRRGRHGLGGSCDGQSKSNSYQPDHCHLH
jgi:hypothetical protein